MALSGVWATRGDFSRDLVMGTDLLRGDPAELAGRYAHTLFFVHGLGHLIGLDVHDMEDFGDLAGYAAGRKRRPEFGNKYLRLDRDLQPGMTLTIEPGIYLVPAIWQRDDLIGPFKDAINKPAIDALLSQQFGGIRSKLARAIHSIRFVAFSKTTMIVGNDGESFVNKSLSYTGIPCGAAKAGPSNKQQWRTFPFHFVVKLQTITNCKRHFYWSLP